MKTPPERSKGARIERKAFRAYLRRQINTAGPIRSTTLREVLSWVLARQKRYDNRKGGLGRE